MDRRTHRELHDLLSALLDGNLSSEQQGRLGVLLQQSREARKLYLAYFDLHTNLAFGNKEGDLALRIMRAEQPAAIAAKASKPSLPLTSSVLSGFVRRHRGRAAAILGLCALAAGIMLVVLSWPQSHVGPTWQTDATKEPIDNTVAVLLNSSGAEWEQPAPPPRAGMALAPGWLRLKSGFAHLEFYSGATVILEAPVELKLISRTEAYCANGKLRVSVPEHAQGFTIDTPKFELVDLGTEFGVLVNAQLKTEIHVFQGKVEVFDANSHRAAATRRELTKGKGVRLVEHDEMQFIPSAPTAFRSAHDVAVRSAEETQRRHDAWLAASEALRQDPSLLVYFPFVGQEPLSRVLRDHAGDRSQPHDGTLVGCSWTTGRWPGRPALEFKRVSDRVRLHVPGTFESITLAAWVRVDALPYPNNSLFMSDGWPVGGFHWQIGEGGKLVLGVKAPSGRSNGHYDAYEVWRPEFFGQWIQLAVVYDREQDAVTHFVDGQPVGQLPIQFDVPLVVGNAEIGNWNNASHPARQPVRALNGCMDEFMLFSRALSAQEISQLYAQGRPPS